MADSGLSRTPSPAWNIHTLAKNLMRAMLIKGRGWEEGDEGEEEEFSDKGQAMLGDGGRRASDLVGSGVSVFLQACELSGP